MKAASGPGPDTGTAMQLATPKFWQQSPPSLTARLLSPLGAIYGGITRRRMQLAGVDAGCPVICIGNFTAGGAGKTPLALLVAEILAAQGRKPFFLSRGYGGTIGAGPLLVDPVRHLASEVGDEPLLLAALAPVVVGADRVAAARLAVAQGANVLVMDDGLQNPSLAKNFSFAVVDGAVGVGNGLCLPAGPLRAPLAAQWPHVAGVVIIGAGDPGKALARCAEAAGKRVFRGRLEADAGDAARLRGQRVVAFAGIGRPTKFFATLAEIGAQLVAQHEFADHHAFSAAEMAALQAQAQTLQAMLVTTRKDQVRLGAAGAQTLALRVRLVLEDALC